MEGRSGRIGYCQEGGDKVSNSPNRSRVLSLSFHHASAQEWETFVRRFATSKKYQQALLLYRRQFVVWYPDLQEWFAAPLVERVGRSDEECRQNVGHHDVQYRASYHARHYLAFLCSMRVCSLRLGLAHCCSPILASLPLYLRSRRYGDDPTA